MSLLDRIFLEPELQAAPPVLVDIGAAGGVTPVWRDLARHAVGVGFEPDERDAARLSEAHGAFRRWIHCPALVAPDAGDGRKPFHLTRSPHCSSLLSPRPDLLQDWLFADLFELKETTTVPAVTLHAALAAQGITGIDWLKCDTQGQDLSIFRSLPESWRGRLLAVEFEPGMIDAYEGEDKFWQVLQAMESEPFWISHLEVCGTPRGNARTFDRVLGPLTTRWMRKAGPETPGWVNVRYLRSLGGGAPLDRRALLLGWVFADLLGQHSQAVLVANEGGERFGGDLFAAMAARSARRLRGSIARRLPRWLWHRLGLDA